MAEVWATGGGGTSGTKDWPVSSVGSPYVVTTTDLDTEIRDRFDWVFAALTGGPTDPAERRAWHLAGVAAPAVNQSARATRVSGTIAEFTSGTHPLVSTFQVDQLSLTAGAAATTTAANLHVQTEPTGATNNYAVYIAGGKTRLVGDLVVNAGIVINNIAAAVSGTDKGLEVVKTDLTAGNAYGIMSRPSASTLQATSLVGVYSRPDKSAGTTTLAIAFQAGSPVISAGSYGTFYGYYVDDIVAAITTKWAFYAGGAINSRLSDVGGKVFIGDTIDTNLTTGLCINQGAADDALLAFKSSDVAHGVTDFAETDTYGLVSKAVGLDGGLRIDGFTDAKTGFLIGATVVTVEDGSAKSAASQGAIHMSARKKSGTGVTALGTGNNILVVYDNTNAKFVVSAEGDLHHASATILTFDEHDDLALLNAFQATLPGGDQIDAEYRTFLTEHIDALYDAGIISSARGDPDIWVNDTRLSMLLVGAARQLGATVRQLEDRLAQLEQKALPAGEVT